MNISRFFIDRPIFAAVIAVFITLMGAFAYPLLPLSQYPEIAPPTINLDNPAVEPKLSLAANQKEPREINVALSNSFGFGGTNASIIFGKVR